MEEVNDDSKAGKLRCSSHRPFWARLANAKGLVKPHLKIRPLSEQLARFAFFVLIRLVSFKKPLNRSWVNLRPRNGLMKGCQSSLTPVYIFPRHVRLWVSPNYTDCCVIPKLMLVPHDVYFATRRRITANVT